MASRKQLARQVLQALDEGLESWEFPSSSSNRVYTVRWNHDHHISCNCRGWTFLRGNHRTCSHTEKVLYAHFKYSKLYRYVIQGALEYVFPNG